MIEKLEKLKDILNNNWIDVYAMEANGGFLLHDLSEIKGEEQGLIVNAFTAIIKKENEIEAFDALENFYKLWIENLE